MWHEIHHWGHVFVWEWLDVMWLPVAFVLVHKKQKLKACGFILLCMLTMRLQVEIAQSMGLTKGVTGFLTWPTMVRGYVSYGFFILLFLVLSYFSPYTRGAIYLAASLSIFFMAFTISSIVMVI